MTNRLSKAIAGVATAAVMTIGSAVWSDTVHDQAAVDQNGFGWDSVSGGAGVQQIADDFRPGLKGTIAKVSWTGKYHDSSVPPAKMFEIRIFIDAGGRPGTVVFSRSVFIAGVDSGITDIGPHRLISYTAELTGGPVLDGNSVYWLSIRENDASTSSVWSWSFHEADVAGGYSYRRGERASWVLGTRDMAYSLSISPKD